MRQQLTARVFAKWSLIASLLSINAIPFWIKSPNGYETVFHVLSAVHAEICLVCVWLLFGRRVSVLERVLWSGMLLFAAWMAACGLLGGGFSAESRWQSMSLGTMETVPGFVTCFLMITAAKLLSIRPLAEPSTTDQPVRQIGLKQLCAFVAAIAYLSVIGRQLIVHNRTGWVLQPGTDFFQWLFLQSAVLGLLSAPCALVILKPNRFSPLWLVYFVVVCAVEPLGEALIHAKLRLNRLDQWLWPEAYAEVVIYNIVWYGPQLLPTAILIAMLRLSSIPAEAKK